MNQDKVKRLYSKDQTARIFFDHMASRERNQSETKVERVIRILSEEGQHIARADVINLFKKLQEIGCGQFVTGRRGWPSRFVWSVSLISASRAAIGEQEEIEELPQTDSLKDDEAGNITHSFHLRPDYELKLELPIDLTPKEAERLASFVKSLPMEEFG